MSFQSVYSHQGELRHVSEPLGRALAQFDSAVATREHKTVVQNLADLGGWTAPEQGTERYRVLEAALASRGMCYGFKGGEGRHDGWSLLRACVEIATERDAMDVRRDRPGYSSVSLDTARTAFTQWGLTEVRLRHAAPGDILLFEVEGGAHAAVMSAPGGELSWAMLPGKSLPEAKIIHSVPARAVVESWAGRYWTTKLVAAFSFDAPKPRPAALKVAA